MESGLKHKRRGAIRPMRRECEDHFESLYRAIAGHPAFKDSDTYLNSLVWSRPVNSKVEHPPRPKK